jgi:hypothetical protein
MAQVEAVETDGQANQTSALEFSDRVAGKQGSCVRISEMGTFFELAYSTRSKTSGRFSGSPISTNTGAASAATSSIRRWASAALNSSGWRPGWAQAIHAGQIACQGGLPNHQKRTLLEVHGWRHGRPPALAVFKGRGSLAMTGVTLINIAM